MDINSKILELRKEVDKLEITALKVVILLERINYYTMGGFIRPRDQNLNLIPFFESDELSSN